MCKVVEFAVDKGMGQGEIQDIKDKDEREVVYSREGCFMLTLQQSGCVSRNNVLGRKIVLGSKLGTLGSLTVEKN